MADPLMLDPQVAWCAEHLEAFRARWPHGYLAATLILFEAFTRLDDVQRYCGRDDATGQLGDADRLMPAVREFGPLCCAAGVVLLRRAVDVALSGDAAAFKALRDEVRGSHE